MTPQKQQSNEISRPFHQTDLMPQAIKERHLGDNMKAIVFGLAADKPDGSTWTKCYYATDEDKLYIWNGIAWKSVTLS